MLLVIKLSTSILDILSSTYVTVTRLSLVELGWHIVIKSTVLVPCLLPFKLINLVSFHRNNQDFDLFTEALV